MLFGLKMSEICELQFDGYEEKWWNWWEGTVKSGRQPSWSWKKTTVWTLQSFRSPICSSTIIHASKSGSGAWLPPVIYCSVVIVLRFNLRIDSSRYGGILLALTDTYITGTFSTFSNAMYGRRLINPFLTDMECLGHLVALLESVHYVESFKYIFCDLF